MSEPANKNLQLTQLITTVVGFALIIIPLLAFVIIIAQFLSKINLKDADWFQFGSGISAGLLKKK